MGYADDLVLLAPSRTAMELMLTASEEFGGRNNLLFSTDPDPEKSKTKCVFMCGRKKLGKPVPLSLYGIELPWVRTATHLWNELCEDGTMNRLVSSPGSGGQGAVLLCSYHGDTKGSESLLL